MRYYVIECGYSHNFRFKDPTQAAFFMVDAAKHLIVDTSTGRKSLELVIVEEPEHVEIEPEPVEPEPVEAEEVSADDPSGV